jgi:putative ABC transport system ATP-binding protein
MNKRATAVSVRGLVKTFEGGRMRALDGVDLDVLQGELLAISGPSGCGKSTLLHLIAALDRPDEGTITVMGESLATMRNVSGYRAREVGLVFQLDNLLPTLNASENVQVPMFETSLSAGERHRRAEDLLNMVGLKGKEHSLPAQLSGGERQRVAIARALANDPSILLADEPTGRLDSASGRRVLDLLEKLRAERELTVVVVTHDHDVARRADRIIDMLDGRVIGEKQPEGKRNAERVPEKTS